MQRIAPLMSESESDDSHDHLPGNKANEPEAGGTPERNRPDEEPVEEEASTQAERELDRQLDTGEENPA